jgi:hypothetical protein
MAEKRPKLIIRVARSDNSVARSPISCPTGPRKLRNGFYVFDLSTPRLDCPYLSLLVVGDGIKSNTAKSQRRHSVLYSLVAALYQIILD